MFTVLFEVRPRAAAWQAYLGYAGVLRPELEQVDGFVDNVRYRSMTRDGWLLSLSTWRDEKALVRWRTHARHHDVQEKGRAEVFVDYHLRVGQVTGDTRVPPGQVLQQQRLDETATGGGRAVVLVDVPAIGNAPTSDATARARRLGLRDGEADLVEWDVYDAVLSPGDTLLMLVWRDDEVARAFERSLALPDAARRRRVRIVRDYGMFDRREAPQYFPDAHPSSG